jgi:hypothetical protein
VLKQTLQTQASPSQVICCRTVVPPEEPEAVRTSGQWTAKRKKKTKKTKKTNVFLKAIKIGFKLAPQRSDWVGELSPPMADDQRSGWIRAQHCR